jgi:hypothetical protein
MPKCQKNATKTGIFALTWSGEPNRQICNLRGNSDVRHFVRVLNLKLYPVDVTCKGSIISGNRLIEFSSNNLSHNPTEWEESVKGLGSGMEHVFSPCVLIPTNAGNGTEIVSTEVKITWPASNKNNPLLLKIQVDA